MRPARAADPRVLALIDKVVQAAAAAGVDVSVCGDAAADPAVLPLLIELGVRKLSVGAARLPHVAQWIADADSSRCAALAAYGPTVIHRRSWVFMESLPWSGIRRLPPVGQAQLF